MKFKTTPFTRVVTRTPWPLDFQKRKTIFEVLVSPVGPKTNFEVLVLGSLATI